MNIIPTFSKMDLAAGSEWTTIPTSDQTYDNGNWIGTFSQTANGDATDMSIEINWTAGASPLGVPITDPTKVGFSSFDTGKTFGTSNKARIFSIAVEFLDITAITNPTDRLIFGLWFGEEVLGSRIATTAGGYNGGEITRVFAPVVDYNYGLYNVGDITQSSLIVASGQVVDPVIAGVVMSVVLSPNGQIILVKFTPFSDPAGLNRTFDGLQPERTNKTGTNFQTPTTTNTIKLGCWWGTNKTAQLAGQNYDFTYRLKYAYTELV